MKLTALQPIRHDGKRYAEGDVLDVKDKKQAQALIDCGAAEEEEGKAKTKAELKAQAEAIAAAEKAVAEAEAALAAAADDAAKAAAQQLLDKAQADLQAAKA